MKKAAAATSKVPAIARQEPVPTVWRRLIEHANPHQNALSSALPGFVVTAVLLATTQITLMASPMVGLYVNAATAVILVAVALNEPEARSLIISLAILPVVNLLMSTIMPYSNFVTAAIYYVALLLLAVTYRYMFSRTEPVERTRLNVRGYIMALSTMVVLAEIAGAVGYGFLRQHYAFSGTPLALVAASCVVFAAAEEVFLRGLVQHQAAKLFHPLVAGLFTAILFVVLSLGIAPGLSIIPAVVLGSMLSLTYYFKQNLILTTTLNAGSKLTYLALLAAFIWH